MTVVTLSDNGRTRIIEINKNKYTLELRDPYGFCHIVIEEGKLPEELSAVFTSLSMAQKSVEIYENSKTQVKKKEGK